MAQEEILYSTADAAKLTGATMRQLQWWDESRVIVAKRDARNFRRYSAKQLKDIRRLLEVRGTHTFQFGKNPSLLKQLLSTALPVMVIDRATVIKGVLVVPLTRDYRYTAERTKRKKRLRPGAFTSDEPGIGVGWGT